MGLACLKLVEGGIFLDEIKIKGHDGGS